MTSRSILGLATLAVLLFGSPRALDAQSWKTVSKSRQLRAQDYLEVEINYAVGRFDLREAPNRMLYRIDSRYDEEAFRLTSNYLETDGRGRLSIDIEGRDGVDFGNLRDYDIESGALKVGLSSAIPMALNLKFGAAKAELDLGGLRLRELLLKTGASDTRVDFSTANREEAGHCSFKAGAASFEVTELGNSGCRRISVSGGVGTLSLDFSGDWGYDAVGDINVGLGTIEITVPAELGVRIERSTFLMSFDAPGFDKYDGGVWVSRNWDTAEHRLTLSVSGALGGITVARL